MSMRLFLNLSVKLFAVMHCKKFDVGSGPFATV